MTFGSLFAGIGGMDLGLERAGMSCAWQVEIDPWCRRVLAKHWPHVQRFEDVRTVALEEENEALKVDCITGGFPCQGASDAGLKGGIANDPRTGLWREYARIVCRLRPRFVLVENVEGLLTNGRGMDCVLSDLARFGYDAEWHLLPAAAFGFPQIRTRLFIVAFANGERLPPADDIPRGAFRGHEAEQGGWRRQRPKLRESHYANEDRIRLLPVSFDGGNDDGIPHRLDRIRGLGNAVVPAIAEYVGRRIMAASRTETV